MSDDVVDDDVFNISEVDNKQPFYELKEFTREYAPQYLPTMERVFHGDDVLTRDIHKIMDILFEIEMPYITKDGITDSKVAHMDDILRRVGGQL